MTGKKIEIHAPAKINLAIDILGKREDGYHEVRMVMQTIELADLVELTLTGEDISLSVNVSGIPCGSLNLAWRAAELLRRTFKIREGVHIALKKNIPVAAGLAGGSTNAAAVLRGLNSLWGLGCSVEQLCELGGQLGSDIPFCLTGGTALAVGRGERLIRLADAPRCYAVLAKPDIRVSTAWAYRNYRPEGVVRRPDIDAMLDALRNGDWTGIAGSAGNVLESVTASAYPEIGCLKEGMTRYGAFLTLMSGSGPTVFGLVQEAGEARRIADRLSRETNARVILTKIINSLEE